MLADLLDGKTLVAVVGEHLDNEVLELRREALRTSFLPVSVELAVQNEVVEVFVFLGLLEGENALNNNKQNDRR